MSNKINEVSGVIISRSLLEEYGYERHYITSERGEKLTGFLFKPEKESNIYLFCAHGYRSCGKREFNGILSDYSDGNITISFEDESGFTFTKKEASWIKVDDFDM
mgnify:CR=1 FL=1